MVLVYSLDILLNQIEIVSELTSILNIMNILPGQVSLLVRALHLDTAKVVGLIPSQGTYRKQPMNA